MKRTILLFLFTFLPLFAPNATEAKPAYCLVALEGCYEDCDDVFGWWNPLTSYCKLGCAIGYVGCGPA